VTTVPALENTQVRFNASGNVIYGLMRSYNASEYPQIGFKDSFRTVSAANYAQISTIYLEKDVVDLACDGTDLYIATVEVLCKYLIFKLHISLI